MSARAIPRTRAWPLAVTVAGVLLVVLALLVYLGSVGGRQPPSAAGGAPTASDAQPATTDGAVAPSDAGSPSATPSRSGPPSAYASTTVPPTTAPPVARPIGGFVDYEIADKHQRHTLSSFSLPSVYYTHSGSTEIFGLTTGGSNRVEHDTDDHYTSGRRQFDGDVQIFPGISQQSVVQVFGHPGGGPILMIKAYGRDNGSLVVTRDTSSDLISNAFTGAKIHIRILHDVDTHLLTVWINGVQKWSGADAGTAYTGGYNIKYGLYGTFTAPTHTVWSNVQISA